jgi:rhodanese-related sulfurtransferase
MKINRILAILAILAGTAAAFTHHSAKNRLYPTEKFETGRQEGQKIHYISAHHLANLLYRKDPVSILDTRELKAYAKYHIPTAVHGHPASLSEAELDSGLVVIYGQSGVGEEISMARELPGKVFVLKGGVEAWYSLVLFPDMLEYKIRNADQLKYIVRRAGFFGGQAQNTQLLNLNVRESRFREGC